MCQMKNLKEIMSKRKLVTTRENMLMNESGLYEVIYYDNLGYRNVETFLAAHDAIDFISDFYSTKYFPKATKAPQDDFTGILQSIGKVLSEKNKRYGNSALSPLQVFGNKSKVGTRLDDKLARIKNSTTLKKNDVADCIGYLVLICKENDWLDFADQLD